MTEFFITWLTALIALIVMIVFIIGILAITHFIARFVERKFGGWGYAVTFVTIILVTWSLITVLEYYWEASQ